MRCAKKRLNHHLPSTFTFTFNVRVTEFPERSVNKYVTGVVPGEKKLPGCLSELIMTGPELLDTVGFGQTTDTSDFPNGMVTETSSGKAVTRGNTVSAVNSETNHFMRIHNYKSNYCTLQFDTYMQRHILRELRKLLIRSYFKLNT